MITNSFYHHKIHFHGQSEMPNFDKMKMKWRKCKMKTNSFIYIISRLHAEKIEISLDSIYFFVMTIEIAVNILKLKNKVKKVL